MLAVVSHDAGGAEVLSSWLLQNPQPFCLVLDGPAVKIFQRKFGVFELVPLSTALHLCDWVLCGTGYQTNLEKQAIRMAKKRGKRSVAFLDHWTNYHERFIYEGVCVTPDEIWVGDIYGEKIASEAFPKVKISLVPNPYFIEIQSEFLNMSHEKPVNQNKFSVLYVCEPIKEHALHAYGDERYWGYTEDDALQFFFENINLITDSKTFSIKVRPHPSEKIGKYDWLKQQYPLIEEISSHKTLVTQVLESDIVVGCESMAMVVALLAKKRVISVIPFGGKGCELPQPQIEYLKDLVQKFRKI